MVGAMCDCFGMLCIVVQRDAWNVQEGHFFCNVSGTALCRIKNCCSERGALYTEFACYCFYDRCSDIDDLILNSLGLKTVKILQLQSVKRSAILKNTTITEY